MELEESNLERWMKKLMEASNDHRQIILLNSSTKYKMGYVGGLETLTLGKDRVKVLRARDRVGPRE